MLSMGMDRMDSNSRVDCRRDFSSAQGTFVLFEIHGYQKDVTMDLAQPCSLTRLCANQLAVAKTWHRLRMEVVVSPDR